MKILIVLTTLLMSHAALSAPVTDQHLVSFNNFGLSALQVKNTPSKTLVYIDTAILVYNDGNNFANSSDVIDLLKKAFNLANVDRLILEYPKSLCEAKGTNANIINCHNHKQGNIVVRAVNMRNAKMPVESPIKLSATTANTSVRLLTSESVNHITQSLQANLRLTLVDSLGKGVASMYYTKSDLAPLAAGQTPHF